MDLPLRSLRPRTIHIEVDNFLSVSFNYCHVFCRNDTKKIIISTQEANENENKRRKKTNVGLSDAANIFASRLPHYVLVCVPIWMQAATGRLVGRPFGSVRCIVHDNRRQRRQTSSKLSQARDLLTHKMWWDFRRPFYLLLICWMALSASSG